MNIGFVLDDGLDKPDGVQQYMLTLGKWLTQNNHNVHYIVGQTKRTDLNNVHSLSTNVSVRFNKNRATIPLPANKADIKDLLSQNHFDVLHIQMPYSPMLAGQVIGLAPTNTAVIGTFHIYPYGVMQKSFSKALSVYLKKSLERFDAVMSTSSAAQSFAQKSFGIKSIVVPNPIDVSRFKNGQKLKRYQDNKINLVFLGRLVKRKGCRQLLEAINLLKSRRKLEDVRVIICGAGPLERSLKSYCERSDLSQIVEFEGFIDEKDKASYLKTADIAVFPSLGGESFGIVLLEAMASGAGVTIGGDNPGYRSVLGEQDGLLFDPTDTEKFATILHEYINKDHLRAKMHTWQNEFIKKFDINVIGPIIVDEYKDALHRREGMR